MHRNDEPELKLIQLERRPSLEHPQDGVATSRDREHAVIRERFKMDARKTVAVPFGTAHVFFHALNLSFTNPASPLDALPHFLTVLCYKTAKKPVKTVL